MLDLGRCLSLLGRPVCGPSEPLGRRTQPDRTPGAGSGFIHGLLDWRALLPLLLLLVAAYAVAPQRSRMQRIAGHALFVGVALGLGFHLLPGFHNPRVIGPVRLTPDAVPFTMYLNLDKPLAGFWLLLAWPALRLCRDGSSWLRGLSIGLLTALPCLGLALLLGKVAFAPKWPEVGWLWAINNLLLVCYRAPGFFGHPIGIN
jgi:hypothetical protein